MFRKTAVLNVSENSKKDDFIGVLLKFLELSNLQRRLSLAATYLKKWLHRNYFLRAFRKFLRLPGERLLVESCFTKVTGEISVLGSCLENSHEGLKEYFSKVFRYRCFAGKFPKVYKATIFWFTNGRMSQKIQIAFSLKQERRPLARWIGS